MEQGAGKDGVFSSRRQCAKRYRVNAQSPIDNKHNNGHNAHMGYKWMKQPTKRKKIITIKAIAERYGWHRNTVTKLLKAWADNNDPVDLYDFWSVHNFINETDATSKCRGFQCDKTA